MTFPLETELSGVPGMTEMRSLTRFGLSQITLIFRDRTDIYRARQLINERLQHGSYKTATEVIEDAFDAPTERPQHIDPPSA